MSWEISIRDEEKFAEVVTAGIADRDGSLKMVQEISPKFERYQIKKVLIDHSNIEDVSGSIPDVYIRPKEFDEVGVPRYIKIAEVIKPEHKDHFKFLELVLLNQGFDFMVFCDRKSALEWLSK